jgi:hypothetical protein
VRTAIPAAIGPDELYVPTLSPIVPIDVNCVSALFLIENAKYPLALNSTFAIQDIRYVPAGSVNESNHSPEPLPVVAVVATVAPDIVFTDEVS